MVSVIVVFPKIEITKKIKNMLVQSGIEVTAICTTGAQVTVAIDDLDEGLIISGYRYVDMMYSELKSYIPNTFDMLLVTSKSHWCDCAQEDIVCLSMPVKTAAFIETVNMMITKIEGRRRSPREKNKKRSKDEQAVIESAKLMLTQKKGMTEEEAHKYLQKSSMDSGVNLMATAQMILNTF